MPFFLTFNMLSVGRYQYSVSVFGNWPGLETIIYIHYPVHNNDMLSIVCILHMLNSKGSLFNEGVNGMSSRVVL